MDLQTVQHITKGMKDPGIGPEIIALMPTRICNLRCFYCRGGRFVHWKQESADCSDELSTQELFNLFLDAKKLGVKEVNLGGVVGEPFCKKDILLILSKIKELGFMGSMTTNGFALNRDIAEFLTRCKWDILLLSLDSSDSRIQHTLRPAFSGENYFEHIIEFLQTLDSLRSKVRVLLNVVITKINYRKFPELMKFANSYKNIESVNVLRLLNAGLPNYELLQLNTGELNEFRKILSAFKGDKKIRYLNDWIGENNAAASCPNPPAKSGSANPCFTNYYILSIDSNGDIIKCPQNWVKVTGLNVRQIPLSKLWAKEHLLFRKGLVKGATCFEGCCTILKEQNRMIRGRL